MRTLSDYSDFLEALIKSLAHETSFSCTPDLSALIEQPRLIAVVNHATPLSWMPAMCTLALEVMKAGGGDRCPRGVVDKWFYTNPVTKTIAEYLTQSDQHMNFDDLVRNFQDSQKTDLIIFPEGAHAMFGDVGEIRTFRSHRFIEISLRTQSPILLAVHRGSEGWSVPLHIPPEWSAWIRPFSKFFGEHLPSMQSLNFPMIPEKMGHFSMTCELYEPGITLQDLSEDIVERKAQLATEAEHIRQRMSEILKR
ncbi:MAG: hypothetical protein COT73_02515 [Bdellovibrio sp. CG10_big_fil_rev_8_21_14_0_10_47_8]|nr:MAG: hypothetical protein COT73_02515 [Bdellovibrio sp. CG10_big_fil_rev_8_21_14_0_10_47_8]